MYYISKPVFQYIFTITLLVAILLSFIFGFLKKKRFISLFLFSLTSIFSGIAISNFYFDDYKTAYIYFVEMKKELKNYYPHYLYKTEEYKISRTYAGLHVLNRILCIVAIVVLLASIVMLFTSIVEIKSSSQPSAINQKTNEADRNNDKQEYTREADYLKSIN